MTNKVKGQVAFKLDGKTYHGVLDFNALAEFEEEAGVENALKDLDNIGAYNTRKMRLLVFCALRQCHEEASLKLAGQIVTANLDKLVDLITSAFPQAEATPVGAAGKAKAAK